jgi:hypothetical protein
MATYNQDIAVPANNDITLRFQVTLETTGALVPISDIIGASWAMTPLEEEVTPIVSKDLVTGGITIPENGVVLVRLLGSDTIGLSGEFTHELRLKDAVGVRTASRGRMRIIYQVANNPL